MTKYTMASPSPLDDMERNIVVLFQRGYPDDYHNIYNKYAPAVLGVLTRTLGNQKLAEDCVKEAFCRIWSERLSYDPQKERLFTWMLKIARGAAMFGAVAVAQDQLDNEIREGIDLVYATDIKAYLHERQRAEGDSFTTGISTDIRAAIQLIYFENCSFAVAAQKLMIPADQLRGEMIKTIKQLKGSVLA
jgi:RNA polymerase sigma factor (sigma-70 family)